MFIYAVNFRDVIGLQLSKIAIKIQFYYCEGVWWRKCCGRRVEMISGSTYHSSDNQGQDAEQGDGPPQVRNPLLCFLCDDYYSEPCLLGCYHTFCARCLRGRELDSKIACPLCGQQTMLRDGTTLPPADLLMRQLIDLANAENPPCANCDKRDKTSMYFCSTCDLKDHELTTQAASTPFCPEPSPSTPSSLRYLVTSSLHHVQSSAFSLQSSSTPSSLISLATLSLHHVLGHPRGLLVPDKRVGRCKKMAGEKSCDHGLALVQEIRTELEEIDQLNPFAA
uniref:RING-type domain-containing protein n=1 Tax=Timema tahoe TaxID=61484 RepID=A0A7R9NWM8_9NEOP|nr:unnamed protein product [Timema tahoe]